MKLPRHTAKVVALILALALLASPILAAEPIAGIASIIDADTIEMHGTRIPIWGRLGDGLAPFLLGVVAKHTRFATVIDKSGDLRGCKWLG